MTDPNGVITTSTYDPRQRLTSTSIGGQTTA
jgi:YD repeat-containing protein